jgi:hypothetical protein
MADQRPCLSVVIPTTHADESLAHVLDTLTQQTLTVGGEIIVVSGVPLPAELQRPGVEIVELPKAHVFELRAAGANAARGEIIAITEDHAVVSDDWAQSTLRAHARHPGAAVIGGAVDNGSRERLMDWANFLMTFGAFLPPITAERHQRMPVIANLSLKRAALQENPIRAGELELTLVPKLVAEDRAAYDDEPLVRHVQTLGRFGTLRAHFENARATMGMQVEGQPWSERRRRGSFRRVLRLGEGAIGMVKEKPLPRRARCSLPLIMLLCATHVAGEWCGAAFGAGQSAYRIN